MVYPIKHHDCYCLYLIIKVQIIQIIIDKMDPNERKRKAPPLPKFQQARTQDSKVVSKVADFLQQISKQVIAQQLVSKTTPSTPIPTTTTPQPVEGEKKKFNLASLNSKLNSIMSAKKIDLNKVVESSKKAVQSQAKQRRDIQIEYDPANPNSYEQSKLHYVQTFQKLKTIKYSKEEDMDEKISKMIAEYERTGEEIDEQIVEQAVPETDINRLDQRQSLALRIMQKHGFKIGDGLGKQSQGIKTPLTIKKLTDSSCKIQLSSLSLANFVTVQQSADNALLAFKIQKSPVIAFKIDMKLNELTDQVQEQIKEQCEKYGKIMEWVAYSTIQSMIFFCQYTTIQEAFKAFTRINGRYYDERIINVFFYPQRLFETKNFSEQLHQVVQF